MMATKIIRGLRAHDLKGEAGRASFVVFRVFSYLLGGIEETELEP